MRLCKALYGCLRITILFYWYLLTDLLNLGFKINPYGPCVSNKTINGQKNTIMWYVDGLKLSHTDPGEVTNILS